MSWTADKDERGRAMWAAGKSSTLIALTLGDGITHKAVLGRAKRQGWPRSDAMRAELKIEYARSAAARGVEKRRLERTGKLIGPRPVPARKPVERRFPGAQVPLLLAREGQCRYFMIERPDWVVCGEPVVPAGSSWCGEHRAKCFTPTARQREAVKHEK